MLIRYPLRVTVNNKRLISNAKKSEKKYAYTNVMVLLIAKFDDVKTVYPPTNTVCGGYKKA